MQVTWKRLSIPEFSTIQGSVVSLSPNKWSVIPLETTFNELMVFWKRFKSKSDVLSWCELEGGLWAVTFAISEHEGRQVLPACGLSNSSWKKQSLAKFVA